MNLLTFLLGERVWRVYGLLVSVGLRIKGVRVGRRLICRGAPDLLLLGRGRDVVIGDDVRLMGPVEIRNRERGKIVIGDGCKIDRGVRLLAANDAILSIGIGTHIGPYCQLNCGADVTIGSKCLIAAFTVIQASNHGIKANQWIKDQPHEHAPIRIGDDVWIGAHASILAGVSLGKGAVIGAGAVVTGPIGESAIALGVPAREVRRRS